MKLKSTNTNKSSYQNDQQLMNIVELHNAFQELNIVNVNEIWLNKICKTEEVSKRIIQEPFIRMNINEFFHNIRLKFLSNKIQAYKNCKFSTLEKVSYKHI